jgi:hypothetical protein
VSSFGQFILSALVAGKSSDPYNTGDTNMNVAWHPSGNLIGVGNKSDHIYVYDVRKNDKPLLFKANFEACIPFNLYYQALSCTLLRFLTSRVRLLHVFSVSKGK